jgi:hypothetical protein
MWTALRHLSDRALRYAVAATVALTGLVILQAATAPAARAATLTWTCPTSQAYLFQAPAGTPTNVYQLNLVTGDSALVGSIPQYVNAIAFNPVDHFMYGWDQTRRQLVRINADFSTTGLGVPRQGTTVLDSTANWTTGEIGPNGHLWLLSSTTGRWAEIDLNPATPTLLGTGIATIPGSVTFPDDWVFIGTTLYGVSRGANTGNRNSSFIVSFSTSTHRFSNSGGSISITATDPVYGAAWSDGTYLYVRNDATGRIYRVTPSNGATTLLSTGPSGTRADGARCPGGIRAIPTVTLVKQVGGRLVPADQFEISLVAPSGTTVASATTTGTQTSVATGAVATESGSTYTIFDRLAAGSTSDVGDYAGSLACADDNNGGVAATPQAIGAWTLPIGTVSVTCTITNTPLPRPRISLAKSVSPQGATAVLVGTVVNYHYVITNTGNVPLTGVTLTEIGFSGTGTAPAPDCAVAALAPGAVSSCEASYTVTAADVLAGTVTNTARAQGADPGGNVQTADASVTLAAAPVPGLELTKTAFPLVADQAGETITYTFALRNSGNVAITGATIAEDSFNGSGTLPPVTCPGAAFPLLPGAGVTCQAVEYTVTQADIDGGVPLTNTATATGTLAGGGTVDSAPDTATVLALQNPHLDVIKAAGPTTVDLAGDVVTYRFTVFNNGNTTVDDLAIDEDAFSGTGTAPTLVCETTTLAPGDETTCEGTYADTQADIDARQITNIGHATGATPTGTLVESLPDDAVVGVVPVEGMTLTKTASPTTVKAAGETLTYSYLVTNTGNQTITDLSIVEVFNGAGPAPTPSCPTTTLAVGAFTTCTATYTVTAADLATGTITNTAHAAGTLPNENDVVSEDASVAVAAIAPTRRTTPTISTRTSSKRIKPGAALRDHVRIARLAGTSTQATARLYGPFPSRKAITCQPGRLARAVTFTVRNGSTRTPAVRVTAAGYYTWQVTTSANAANNAATHRCGLASETTLVARAAYPTPIINGGFSGILPRTPYGRAGVVTVRLPRIGLDAPVRTAGVSGGRMELPGDVGEVGWLRRSATGGDAIGTTVIAGHVSSRRDAPGAMHRLSSARKGDRIAFTQGGTTYRFKVVEKATYVRGHRLPRRYFSTTGKHRLVLISCTGRVVHHGRFHYARYQVVVAEPVRR